MAKIFSTDDPGIVRLHFSDTTTAFDGIKRAVLKGKGISCCTVCSALFQALEKASRPILSRKRALGTSCAAPRKRFLSNLQSATG